MADAEPDAPVTVTVTVPAGMLARYVLNPLETVAPGATPANVRDPNRVASLMLAVSVPVLVAETASVHLPAPRCSRAPR